MISARIRFAIAIGMATAGAVIFINREAAKPAPSADPQPASAPTPKRLAAVDAAQTHPPPTPVPYTDIAAAIAAILDRIRADDPAGSVAALNELRDQLRAADPQAAIRAIRTFLATGRDAKTGAPFRIAGDGLLDTAPSLRVFLLDVLGELARANHQGDAAEVAATIFSRKDSADEWAIAIRNTAWIDGNAPALAQRFSEMLSYPPWRDDPSGGYIESFDVAVFTRDISLLPRLAEMTLLPDEAPLKRAANVALDRLSENAPLEVMTYLNEHPDVMAAKPLLRADYFTKADLDDPRHRAALDTYLTRSDVTVEEKTKFVRVLLAPGKFVSPALLTPDRIAPEPPDRTPALQTIITGWRNSGRYPELRTVFTESLADLAEE